jgi:hypothetical protein
VLLEVVVTGRRRPGSAARVRSTSGWQGWGEGHERQAEVADLAQQAVQCRLVDDGSVENGRAVRAPGQGHAVEPGGPALGRCPFTRIAYRSGSWTGLTLVASYRGARWNTSRVTVDVVRRHHHTW